MNPVHGSHPSDEPTRLFLRYRLAVIAVFLLSVVSAGLVDRAYHGGRLAHAADEVHSTP